MGFSSGEYAAYINDMDRKMLASELSKTEDWIYDTEDATKTQYVDKLNELKWMGDPVAWRCSEANMRAEWIVAVEGTITNYRVAAQHPGEKFGHIAAEKLAKIVQACAELQQWLDTLKSKQATMPKTERPVLLCADMEKKNQELARMANNIFLSRSPHRRRMSRKKTLWVTSHQEYVGPARK